MQLRCLAFSRFFCFVLMKLDFENTLSLKVDVGETERIALKSFSSFSDLFLFYLDTENHQLYYSLHSIFLNFEYFL